MITLTLPIPKNISPTIQPKLEIENADFKYDVPIGNKDTKPQNNLGDSHVENFLNYVNEFNDSFSIGSQEFFKTFEQQTGSFLQLFSRIYTIRTKTAVLHDLLQLFFKHCKENYIPDHQFNLVIQVIEEIANNYSIISGNVRVHYSIDNEIIFYRNGEQGNHYIFVGDEFNDLTYAFVGYNRKGDSRTVDANFSNVGLYEIVNEFLNG